VRRDPATARAEGRLIDRALVLTVVAVLLLTPPIIGIFDRPVLVLGIPLLHVYCYAVWLIAIGCGFRLAARLTVLEEKPKASSDTGPSERG
jgi:hypothetical protein